MPHPHRFGSSVSSDTAHQIQNQAYVSGEHQSLSRLGHLPLCPFYALHPGHAKLPGDQ